MVRQLLDFARGADGSQSPVELEDVLGDVRTLLTSTLAPGFRLRTQVEPDLPVLMANSTQLGQVVLNLCWNARDAMLDGGTIEIEGRLVSVTEPEGPGSDAAKPGEFVAITVKDEGSGIRPEDLDAIFEPFFTTKSTRGGTGLGLSTVLSVVRGHGGFIRVRSQVGAGTAITVHLPVGSTGRRREPTPGFEGGSVVQGRHVLVVDDDEAILGFIARLLRQAGFTVDTATDGIEVLERVEARVPDLVLTDLHMPRVDGLTLIGQLGVRWPELPCLLMSGRMDEPTRRRLEDRPDQNTLEKPFGRAELLAAVARALGAAPASSGTRRPSAEAGSAS